MTNRIDHTNCTHEATKAARALCRKAQGDRRILAEALVKYLDTDTDGIADWLLKGATRFDRSRDQGLDLARTTDPTDRIAFALILLDYFFPAEAANEDWARNRKANGYTITSDPATIRRIILHSYS